MIFKRAIDALAGRCGYNVVRRQTLLDIETIDPDLVAELKAAERSILGRIGPYTMTSPERVVALIKATRYVAEHRIPGAIVECGVWRGGSMMAAALTLLEAGDTSRDLYLFDTFEGMSAPTAKDRDASGKPAGDILASTPEKTGVWCFATLEDVRGAMRATGYPEARIHMVQGKVESTIPHGGLTQIALLRLDTDWYESTFHELTHLYPMLSVGGVLIIDDYGHWQGAREATDQFLAENRDFPLLLHRVDYTGRIAVKTGARPRS